MTVDSVTSLHPLYTVTSLISQIVMTSSWLLLLLMVGLSSLRVNSQSTTDDERTCSDGGEFGELLGKLQSDVGRILDNQQRLFQLLEQRPTVTDSPYRGKS